MMDQENREYVNECTFVNLRVLKVTYWQHSAILLRCYQGGEEGAYLTLFVEDGVEASLEVKAGQYLNVEHARVRTKDTTVPMVEALKRSQLRDKGRTLEADAAYYAERLGLDEGQTRGLRGLLKRTKVPKSITEFVVKTADITTVS